MASNSLKYGLLTATGLAVFAGALPIYWLRVGTLTTCFPLLKRDGGRYLGARDANGELVMKKVSHKEFAAVIALRGPERYGYFVKQVADWEELWTLRTDGGFILMAADDGCELVPVWPHRRFAEACAKAQWKDAEAVPIPLERWLEAWTPGMKKDNRSVAVFPVPSGSGIVVTPDRLREDLRMECSKYE